MPSIDAAVWAGRAPWPHQVEAVDAALGVYRKGYTGYMLRMTMGTGKSATAAALLRHLHGCGVVGRCLIVCPLAVCEMWRRELLDLEAVIIAGTPAKREKLLADAGCVAIINYESAWREAAALKAWNPDMVIADESHKIKSHRSHQSKGVTDIAKSARFRLALTGTPMPQGAVDVFAQFRFLDERIFGKNFYQFRGRYCNMGGFKQKQIVGYHNLDEFEEIYDRFSFGVGKDAVAGMPDMTTSTLYAELQPCERKAYDMMRDASIAILESEDIVTAPLAITRCLRLSEIAGGFLHDDDGAVHRLSEMPSKLAVARDHIDTVVNDGGEKLVIFARFTAEVEALFELCENMSIGVVRYDGKISAASKSEAVRSFTEDDDVRVFVGNIAAAGTGLDGLQQVCTKGLMYSCGYSFAEYDQAMSRLHRSGAGGTVHWARIEALRTIDGKVSEAVDAKRDFAASIGTNWRGVFE